MLSPHTKNTLNTQEYIPYIMDSNNSQSVQAEECDVSKMSAKIKELEMDKFMLERVIAAFRQGLDELSREYKGVAKAFDVPSTHVNTVLNDLVSLAHGKEGYYFTQVSPFLWRQLDYKMVGEIS